MRKVLRKLRIILVLTMVCVFMAACNQEGNTLSNNSEDDEKTEKSSSKEGKSLFGLNQKTEDEVIEDSKSTNNEDSSQNIIPTNGNGISDPKAGAEIINITSDEAVALAYEEATKWNKDAVLWKVMTAIGEAVHYDWINTGKAYHWLVGFANPTDDSMIQVWVKNGKVDSVEDVGNKRHSDINSVFLANKLMIPLTDAIGTMINNGAPTGYMPYSIEYTVTKNDDGSSSCHWFVGYEIRRTDNAKELQIYMVDGLTGEFISSEYRVFYDNDEDEDKNIKSTSDRTVLEFPQQDLSGRYYTLDQRYTIVKFLSMVNEGYIKEAIDMMDSYAVPNDTSRQMWGESLNAIRNLGIDIIYTENEEEWTEDYMAFEVKLFLPNDDSITQFGWDLGSTTRWFTLQKDEYNEWKIHAIATSP